MIWQGAKVILHPTTIGTIDRERERLIARSNAACNQCYFLDVNNAGDLDNAWGGKAKDYAASHHGAAAP